MKKMLFPMYMFMYMVSFCLVMSTGEWFMMWVGLEINMMSFIMLMYNGAILLNVESCLKYFFIQSVGSGILLCSFFSEVMEFLVCLVLSYKMGAGIFFFWLPLVSESLTWVPLFFLLTLQKILPLLIMSSFINFVIWIIISFSLLLGVLGVMNQTSIKRLFAFSSIHHMGWILMVNYLNLEMWVLYLMSYVFMMMGLIYYMEKAKWLYLLDVNMSHLGVGLLLGFMNMGGIPPMFGFFISWWVFMFLFNINMLYLLFMILMSVMMLYVYISIVFSFMMGFKGFVKKLNFFSLDSIYIGGIFMGPMMGGLLIV